MAGPQTSLPRHEGPVVLVDDGSRDGTAALVQVCTLMADSPLGRSADLPGPSVLGFLACGAVVRRDAYLAAGGFDDVVFLRGEEDRLARAARRRPAHHADAAAVAGGPPGPDDPSRWPGRPDGGAAGRHPAAEGAARQADPDARRGGARRLLDEPPGCDVDAGTRFRGRADLRLELDAGLGCLAGRDRRPLLEEAGPGPF